MSNRETGSEELEECTTHADESDIEDNRKVLAALKSLVSPDTSPEVERATFHAELSIEYPLVEETEEEAAEWLIDVLERDGDQIKMTVEKMEREQ